MLKETLIFVGSGTGGLVRYWFGGAVTTLVGRHFPDAWPIGTLAVNVLGCATMGVLLVVLSESRDEWRVTLLIGLLGGFTTFSAFSKESFELAQAGRWAAAAAYVATSVILCLAGVAAGWWAAKSLAWN